MVPAGVSYDSTTNVATLTPQAALQYGATYTATVKGGAGGVTDYVGNPLASDVSWSFTTEASPPPLLVVGSSANPFGMYLTEILRDEGLDAFTTLDASLLSSSVLSNFDVVLLGDTALSAGQVTTLTNWVNGGGKLIAMHPDKQLAGLLGLSDAGSTLSNAYLKVDTASGPGVGITGQTIQFHGSADRYTLNGATAVATLYSNATTATANPAVTLRSVGSSGGQAAAFTLRPRPLGGLHAPGEPCLGRSGARRGGRDPPRRHVLRGESGGCPARLDRHEQDRDPAGRRAAAPARQPDHPDGAHKLPLPHFWYLPRGEKAVVVLSGDDHAQRRHREQLRPLQAAQPARLRRRELGMRALDLVHLHGQPAHQRAGRGLHRRRLRGRPAPASWARAPRPSSRPTTSPRPSTASWLPSRRSTRACPRRSRAAPTASTGPTGPRRRRSSSARGIRMDGNYYHYPAAWIGVEAGLPERRRLPDALRRSRRVADRRLRGEHEHDGRIGAVVPGDRRHAARQRDRAARLLRRLRHEHPQRHHRPAARRRGDRRLRAGARRAADLLQAAARLDGRPQRLDDPRPELERRHVHLRHHRRRRAQRPPDAAPDPGPDGHAERADAAADRRVPTRSRRSRASSTRCSTRSPAPARRRTRSVSAAYSRPNCADDQASLDFCVAWAGAARSDHVHMRSPTGAARSALRGRVSSGG